MANEMMAGSDKAMIPERDIKPEVENLERMLAEVANASPEDMAMADTGMAMETPEGAAEMTEVMEADGTADAAMSDDAQALAEALNIDGAQAQALFDAAQQMQQTQGKSGKELAEMLANDFGLRMQLEKLAGGAADQMAMEATEVVETEAPE
jgi:hypothetical protein